MTNIVIDRLSEEDFRRSIENRLRERRAGAAIERLRGLLGPYCGPGKILPGRFLTVDTGDLVLSGWDALDESIRRYDRPGSPITAISIAFGWPGEEPRPRDAEGRLQPYVETRYFTDAAFPFSESTRDDLLDGYSSYGCSWGDDCEAMDTALAVGGIDDLHAALADLEEELLASANPDEDGVRAGSLGSCLLSVLLFQAVIEQVEQHGLPRPLCVTAGSSGVYPYFDAPVVGMPVARAAPDPAKSTLTGHSLPDDLSQGAPACRYSSLLVTGIPRAKKRAVLVLEENEAEMAGRIARLRNNGAELEAEPAPSSSAAPVPDLPGPDTILPDMTGASPLMVKKPRDHALDIPAPTSTPASVPPPLAPPEPLASELPAVEPGVIEPAPANRSAVEPDVVEPDPADRPAAAPDPLDAADWLTRLTTGPVESERNWTPALPGRDDFVPLLDAVDAEPADVPLALNPEPLWQAPPPDVAPPAEPEVLAEPAAPAPRRAGLGAAFGTMIGGLGAALGTMLGGLRQLVKLWRNRKGPPPPPRRRFPPR